jgi:hypothetical protein
MRKMLGYNANPLTTKIGEAQAEVNKLTADIESTKGEIGVLLAGDGNDKQADKLQQKREELSRALERAEIRLEALKKEMPAAEQLDAQARLNEILGEAQALFVANEKAREDYLAALKVLMGTIGPSFEPAVKLVDLKAEAAYWADVYDLPSLTLPEIQQPDPNPIKQAFMDAVLWHEKQFNIWNEWRDKLAKFNGERRRQRVSAENRQRREAGMNW